MKILLLILGVSLLFFGFVLVDHHRDIPHQVQQQRDQLLSAHSGITARLQPVGQISVASKKSQPESQPEPMQAVAAIATDIDGQQVYQSGCIACHGAGVAGAPKVGDAGLWAERIAKGTDALYANAIQGITGNAGVMPAKGGNAALSDDEVKAAVDYMLANSK